MSETSSQELGIWKTLGKRRSLPILKIIGSKEPVRFCEIKRLLAGISGTMLSEGLVELENEGLVTKRIQDSKIKYSITAGGRELEFILAKLDRWWYVQRRTYHPVIAN